jgi:hypothetical protein
LLRLKISPRSHTPRGKALREPTLFDFLSSEAPSDDGLSQAEETPTPTLPRLPPAETLDHPLLDDSLASASFAIASSEKGKARDILAAIRVLKQLDEERRRATPEERQTLARFAGFGSVALGMFPDPVNGTYKDSAWQELGEELMSLLTPEEYDSAKRTTLNAYYTSPVVIRAMHKVVQFCI